MKKLLILAAAIIVFAGCQRDLLSQENSKPQGKIVTFVASMGNPLSQPFEGGTRFDTGDFSDIEIPPELDDIIGLRFICQAWQGEHLVETFVEIIPVKQMGTPMEITLPKGNYDLLFWADMAFDVKSLGTDNGEFDEFEPGEVFWSHYGFTGWEGNSMNLKHVSNSSTSGLPFMFGMAFSGALLGQEITEDYELPVLNLDRCVGRVEISATNIADYEGQYNRFVFHNITNVALAYNVATDDVFVDDTTTGTGSWWVSSTEAPYVWMANTATGEVCYTYAFAAKDGSTKLDTRLTLYNSIDETSGSPVAGRTINNIPVKQNQRTRVMTTLLDESQNNIIVKSKLQTVYGKELAPAVTVEWTDMGSYSTTKIVLTPSVSTYGYNTITYTLSGLDATAQKVVITDPLIIPETEYTVSLLDDTDAEIISTTHTTAALRSTVQKLYGGSFIGTPVDPRSTIQNTDKDTVYMFPGYYDVANNTGFSKNLVLVGADPSAVYYATAAYRLTGTIDRVVFRNIHLKSRLTTSGTVSNVFEFLAANEHNIGLILFDGCEIDMSDVTARALVSSSLIDTNAALGNIGEIAVNNCIGYWSGVNNTSVGHAVFHSGSNVSETFEKITLTNSTFVNTNRGLVVRGVSTVEFGFDVVVDHCTMYNMVAVTSGANNLIDVRPDGPEQKSLTITNNVIHYGGPRYFWTQVPGTPINVVSSNNYGFSGQTPSATPAAVRAAGCITLFNGAPDAFWQNPTLDPSTFDFHIIAAGITNVGDPRWN